MLTTFALQSPSTPPRAVGSLTPNVLAPRPGTLVGPLGSYFESAEARPEQVILANAPLEVIRNALDAVMYGGARVPLFAEHHLAAASTERLREHAEMLSSVIGPRQIGSPVPSTGAELMAWILQVQRTHLEPHRPKLSSVRVSPPVSARVTPVASAVQTPTTSFVPPVMRSTPPTTPVVSFVPPPLLTLQTLPTLPPMTPQSLPPRTSSVPDELEFVMIGGVEVPFFLESQLRALHPLKLRSHAMALQRTLHLPMLPAAEQELVPWVLEIQRRHLDVYRLRQPATVAHAAPGTPVGVQATPLLVQHIKMPSVLHSPPAAVLPGAVRSAPARMPNVLPSTPGSPAGAIGAFTASSLETSLKGAVAAPILTAPVAASYLQSPRISVPVQSTAPAVYDMRIAGRLTPPPSWTPDPFAAAQNGIWNAGNGSMDIKLDMNGKTPSLASMAPNILWNSTSPLSETKMDLNGTGMGVANLQTNFAPNIAATAPAGGNVVGSMLAYPSWNQPAAALGNSSLLENGAGSQTATNGGVEQVVFYGVPLPFYSDQQLQAMSTQQLREQANVLFKTIGSESIGTIIPPLDNDLLTWVRWVQMVHLDPLRRVNGFAIC